MLGYFPTPHPGELFYSVLARYCDTMQFPSHKQILNELLKTNGLVTAFELPKGLARFVAQLPPGHERSVDVLIHRHTMLPFYAPFLPPERLALAQRRMTEDSFGPVHMLLGVFGNRSNSVRFLRYCPCCSADDQARVGETFWHRVHQVPGVEVCPDHRVFLEPASVVDPIRATTSALVTAQSSCPPVSPRKVDEMNLDHRFLLSLATDATWLLDQPPLMVGPGLIHRHFLNLAIALGWVTCDGTIATERIWDAFAAKCSEQTLTALNCQVTPNEKAAWVSRLLWSSKSSQPPIRQLVLMQVLGCDAVTFFHTIEHLDKIPRAPFGAGPWRCRNPVCSSHDHQTITEVQLAHSPFRKKTIGIFTCPLCGYSYGQAANGGRGGEPWVKDYGPVWRTALKDRWMDCRLSVAFIARVLGVDPITARRQASKLGCSAHPRLSLGPGARLRTMRGAQNPQKGSTKMGDTNAGPEIPGIPSNDQDICRQPLCPS